MSVLALPADTGIARMVWELQRNDVMSGVQSLPATDPLWRLTIELTQMLEADSGALKALLLRLRGGVNQLEMHDHSRPAPVGTMRGTMTLNADVSAAATTLEITAGVGQADETLNAGDWLGIGSGTTQQLVMVTADATANGSGVISVSVQPPLRNAFSAGQSVVWDAPKALFRRMSNQLGWDYRGKNPVTSGMALDLIEDVRA